MITRLVKMTFRPEATEAFEKLFFGSCDRIRQFPGCTHLELLKDGHIYFTYSRWEKASDLEAYRHSALFAEVWGATKQLFAAAPEAWSTEQKFLAR